MKTGIATLSLIALFSSGVAQTVFAAEERSSEAVNPQRIVFVAPATSQDGYANVNYKQIYDRKYNTAYYVAVQPESEFVGTGARASEPAKAKPSWYKFGHP